MSWQTEPPAGVGVFWARERGELEPRVVQIASDGIGGCEVLVLGHDCPLLIGDFEAWSGPIEPPAP